MTSVQSLGLIAAMKVLHCVIFDYICILMMYGMFFLSFCFIRKPWVSAHQKLESQESTPSDMVLTSVSESRSLIFPATASISANGVVNLASAVKRLAFGIAESATRQWLVAHGH